MSDTPHGGDQLLTVNEAAELLRHRPSTVRSWIMGRRIPFVKFSRRVFLRRGDLEAIISAGVVLPARATAQASGGRTDGSH
jgi:excisionase family DNA binding protein